MPKGDISHVLRSLNRMVKKSREKMKKSPLLALNEIPSTNQVKELKRAVKGLNDIHKTIMRLAAHSR